jgi:hypothetical protein
MTGEENNFLILLIGYTNYLRRSVWAEGIGKSMGLKYNNAFKNHS